VSQVANQAGYSIGGHSRAAYGRDAATLAKCRAENITFIARA
jgi:hypothetical protein